MKRSTLKIFTAMAAVMGLAASASADLLYTFDTDATGGTQGGVFNAGSYAWSSTYQAVQQTLTVGGYTAGNAGGPRWEFNWPAQSVMQAYAAGPGALLSVDLTVNDDSLALDTIPPGGGIWYNFSVVGNSGGGWTQNDGVGGGWITADNVIGYSKTDHLTFTFAQLGYTPGAGWFQLFFGSNSDGSEPIQFFIDNISVTPEPSTFALTGLGAAALLIFRRRS